jgi:undecaprenyl-diphosphatase
MVTHVKHMRPVVYARDLVRKEFELLVTILVIVVALWTFLWLAEAVRGGTIQQLDDAVLLALRQPDHRDIPRGPVWLLDVMRDITSLGGAPVIFLLTVSVAGYLALRRKIQPLVLLIVASAGGALLDLGLKTIIARGRPEVVPHLMTADSLSFPSGHSLMSMVVYVMLAALLTPQLADRRTRVYVIAVALLFTLMIGVSRVYLGLHYPSDVLGGWSLGLAWATICWLVAWYLERRRSSRATVGEEEPKQR